MWLLMTNQQATVDQPFTAGPRAELRAERLGDRRSDQPGRDMDLSWQLIDQRLVGNDLMMA